MSIAQDKLGQSIPADTIHAVSVSLPTWRSNVGYEEGEEWVTSKMQLGYPRFFIHPIIASFAELVAQKYGLPGDSAMLFATPGAARRCQQFMSANVPSEATHIRVADFVRAPQHTDTAIASVLHFSAVLFPKAIFKHAKTFWQHTGEGVQSRRAEYCRREYEDGGIVEKSALEQQQRHSKGPKRYRKPDASIDGLTSPVKSSANGSNHVNGGPEGDERIRFLEERFGRNLNLDHTDKAKMAIRRRIAGSLTKDTGLEEALTQPQDSERMRDVAGFSVEDVYLYPCGMNAIYNTHRKIMVARGPQKSICFGFPYIDTLKVLEKFGPGCLFYGHGSSEDIDDLEQRLQNGERYLALFAEFPSNPLLKSPDLQRLRSLADKYGFAIVIDETIGNFLNVNVLPYADVVVSSLTKIFSGDSNVMGGSGILNPNGQYYELFKKTWASEYEDHVWPEDAVFLERNSRDFVSRIERINVIAEALCEKLCSHPKIKAVYYPKIVPSRPCYDHCRTKTGGYGGLLSATFYSEDDAEAFYDKLDTEKGPSLGTNFTLASPFVLLAHYTELDWAAQYGAEKNLIRFSVGLEDAHELMRIVDVALAAISQS